MDDPFVLSYQASELQIAAEFLTNWLPFLTKDLCHSCKKMVSDRVRSLDTGNQEHSGDAEHSNIDPTENLADSSPNHADSHDSLENYDTNSLGSWKDGANELENLTDHTASNLRFEPTVNTPGNRMSWADMAQEEDELEDEEREVNRRYLADEGDPAEEEGSVTVQQKKPMLSREQREYIRFTNVQREKDFICLERIKGKIVNILSGLELHAGVFSAVEQKRIVDFIYVLQEMGKKGQLKERTYSEPAKWMRGKGRVTIQFGCCYNYAMDKNRNPPGILRDEAVDPIPHLFKIIIKRLVGWHVLPPSCIPDSCIVNIYDEGDCIPPHIDNHDFVRPFCTVSFLSECNIIFGSNLNIVGPGEFTGAIAIPLPVGSVLVLNGNGADVAKHCVPAVPSKRISITFRRMDDTKRPFGFVPEPDLQDLQPLPYDLGKLRRLQSTTPKPNTNRLVIESDSNGTRESTRRARGGGHLDQSQPSRGLRSVNKRRVRVNLPRT